MPDKLDWVNARIVEKALLSKLVSEWENHPHRKLIEEVVERMKANGGIVSVYNFISTTS